jgi:hypothetical protein
VRPSRAAPWLPDLVAELLSFPHGRNDDQCDALGLAGQLLDLVAKAYVPSPPVRKEPSSGYQLYADPDLDPTHDSKMLKTL